MSGSIDQVEILRTIIRHIQDTLGGCPAERMERERD
jgi:hypothetical protein